MTQDVEASSGSELGLPSPKERRWLRESGGLTYEEAAAEVGVTATTVRSWECGRTEPRGRTREAYAALLDRLAAAGAAPVRPVAAGPPTHRPRPTGKRPARPPATHATPSPAPATTRPAPDEPDEAHGTPAPAWARPHPTAPAAAPPEAPATPTSATGEPGTTLAEPAGQPADSTEEPFQQTVAEPEPPAPAEPTAPPGPVYGPRPRPPRDAVEAFDTLYDHTAGALVRQAYLLTGRRALALHSVEVAFRQAWGRWPEVATDRDPVGWVRSAAHEYALSPWHRFRRAHRHPDKPPADPADRILLDALLALPPVHRRTVLLYDGVGLDLPDTAAETEASTPATGHRLLRAHAELARRIPLLAGVTPERRSAVLRERLGAVRPAVSLEPRPAATVRTVSEHRARRLARAALVLTAVIAASTGYTTVTAPDHYEPPVAPGASVSGVPPLSGPPRVTETSRYLQDKLRADPAAGPHRLHPKLE